ncbi:MAG: serine/threonine protein kinase, partial [Planctomycetaceae bacterium]|nr:serine/threonine protein kinase [Planctomycetaceae bacterium]
MSKMSDENNVFDQPTMIPSSQNLDGNRQSSVLPEIAGYSGFKEIGRGGMGTVYEAVQRSLNRKVAVKILNPGLSNDQTIVKRFQNETRILAKLDRHPNIVQVFNCGLNKRGQLCYIMELVTGKNGDTKTLRELISPQKKVASFINEKQTADLVLQIAEALKYAHENHIIHRDLKPENILIDDRFDQLHVKVTDFGIAAWRDPERTELTSATASFGTWAYMPPEQHRSAANIDHHADIYSLGVMIYEMLTGRLPLGAFVLPSKSNSSLNRGWDKLITAMLQQDPRERPQNMQEVIDRIKSIQTKKNKVTEFSLEQIAEFAIRSVISPLIFLFSNKKALAILGIVTLVCLIIFARMLYRNDKKDDDSTDTVVTVEETIPAQSTDSKAELPTNNFAEETIPAQSTNSKAELPTNKTNIDWRTPKAVLEAEAAKDNPAAL